MSKLPSIVGSCWSRSSLLVAVQIDPGTFGWSRVPRSLTRRQAHCRFLLIILAGLVSLRGRGKMDATPSPGIGLGIHHWVEPMLPVPRRRQLDFENSSADDAIETVPAEESDIVTNSDTVNQFDKLITCKCKNTCHLVLPQDVIRERRNEFAELEPAERQRRCYIELNALASKRDRKTGTRSVSTR